jgi:hypothetical protein
MTHDTTLYELLKYSVTLYIDCQAHVSSHEIRIDCCGCVFYKLQKKSFVYYLQVGSRNLPKGTDKPL